MDNQEHVVSWLQTELGQVVRNKKRRMNCFHYTSLRLQQAPLSGDIEIIQTPYLTSVVKLCLHRILEHLGALPLNDMEEETFTKRKSALDQAIGPGRAYEISHTLNKFRYTQFHMNL
ncbi:hypothetical protein N7488_008086 [Penicillium malachiteum]|nr:hypothetical protein N7488_008086 [Penicillium malachiteum]